MIGKRIDTHLVILFDFSSVKFFSARVQKTTSTHNNQRLQKRNQSLKHKKMRLAFKSPLHSWLSWSVLCFHKGILFFPFFIIVVYIFILYTRFLTLLYFKYSSVLVSSQVIFHSKRILLQFISTKFLICYYLWFLTNEMWKELKM